MFEVVYTPRWFYGKDIAIDVVSILVLALIALFSLRCAKLDRQNKNYLWLAASFGLLALSFVFKILMNFTLYFYEQETAMVGKITVVYNVLEPTTTLFLIGFIVYHLLGLLGLYALFSIYHKQSRSTVILVLYLLATIVFFSHVTHYLFHLTSLILLALLAFHYAQYAKKSKALTTKMLTASFLIIGLSQPFFIFMGVRPDLYVVAECIQLVGYLLLLFTFLKVLYGKAKPS